MKTIFDQSDPTWVRDITEETPPQSQRVSRRVAFPAVVAFAISSMAAGAASSQASIPVNPQSTHHNYVQRESEPYGARMFVKTWGAAMDVLRGLGEDPDDIVRRANQSLQHWREHPAELGGGSDDEFDLGDDET